jgi:hydroxyacylglutathione hydrolase
MQITCLSTPGHTDDSICYAVADTSVSSSPIVVFTGDTLFVNEVGRTDLVDKKKHAEMSKKLYRSLHEKLLPIGNDVIIHPAHGAGSVCGGDIGDREFSTIGYEKKHNKWLSLNEDEFVKAKVNQSLTLSSYFKRCEKLNTDGPPLLTSLDPFQSLSIDEFEKLVEQPEHRAIDTRSKYEFLEDHIPKSISISLGHIGLLAGWALRSSQTFSFILSDNSHITQASAALHRVGLDTIIGYLENGYEGWKQSGKSVSSIPTVTVENLYSGIQDKTIQVVDIREEHEFHQERIESSESYPLTRLEEEMHKIDSKKEIVTICPSGFRSTTAVSMLERAGYEDVRVLPNGLKEWKQKGYPIISSLHL